MWLETGSSLVNAHVSFQSLLVWSFSALVILAHPQIDDRNCWKQLANIGNGPRQEHGVAAVGNLIYVVGGTKMSGFTREQDNSVEVYNIKTDSWSVGPPLPVAIHHPNVVAVSGKLYVLGGLDGFNPTRKTLGSVYRLDPAVNKWEELLPMPKGTERGGSAVAVKDSVIYIAGGLQPQLGDADYGMRVTDLVSSYNTTSGNWTMLPKLPEKRDHVGGAYIGDIFYVVGGRLGAVPTVRDTTYGLKSGTTSWNLLAKMPTARGGHSTAVLGKKIYTFGGEGNKAPGTQQVFPDCEVFDTVTGSWAREPNMRRPRHGTQAVVAGDLIYIAGGGLSGGGFQSTAILESYGPGNC
jgi:N-acetylneuraminic acid mutarotase